jgi:hypothetical protein
VRRLILLLVTVLFVTGLTILTVLDIIHNGVTYLDVVSLLIVAFLAIALIGALTSRQPPAE